MEIKMFLEDPKQNQLIGVPLKQLVRNPYYDATELDKRFEFKQAEMIYHQLLNSDFDNSALLAALGMNLCQQGAHGAASHVLKGALHHFADFLKHIQKLGITPMEQVSGSGGAKETFFNLKKSEVMNALGSCYKQENNIAPARYWFEKSQALLEHDNPDIQNNLGTLYINEGKPEQALPNLRRAIVADPKHSQAHWNISLAQLEMGDYAKGFDNYKWGKRASVRAERNYSGAITPEWDGSPGRVVVVYGEQGIGDEIMFASCIPELIRDSKQVIFECHQKLHRLFCNSFPMIDCYGTREDPQIQWTVHSDGKTPKYAITHKVAVGDLPRFYRRSLNEFPGQRYVVPTTESQLKWVKVLDAAFPDKKPVIAISWIGGHKKTRLEVRSVTLESMLPILQQDAHFVSMQYTDHEQEIFDFEQAHPGIKIHHWPGSTHTEHYDDNAGLLANVDLVITVCTSLVHLAGSMGVPCWVLTPSRPAWRYRLDLDYMPWYGKTVTLFRQSPGSVDWEPVINEVAASLTKLIGGPA